MSRSNKTICWSSNNQQFLMATLVFDDEDGPASVLSVLYVWMAEIFSRFSSPATKTGLAQVPWYQYNNMCANLYTRIFCFISSNSLFAGAITGPFDLHWTTWTLGASQFGHCTPRKMRFCWCWFVDFFGIRVNSLAPILFSYSSFVLWPLLEPTRTSCLFPGIWVSPLNCCCCSSATKMNSSTIIYCFFRIPLQYSMDGICSSIFGFNN